jgi:hypothetical protein
MESAVNLVGGWVLHPGVVLQGLFGSEYAPGTPMEVPESGKLADAEQVKPSIPAGPVPPAPELPPTGAELPEEEPNVDS